MPMSLQSFLPSKGLAAGLLVEFVYLIMRYRYPTKLPFIHTLVDWILTVILYLIAAAALLIAFITLVIEPLASYWGIEEEEKPEDSQDGAIEGTSHQPYDEESLATADSNTPKLGARRILSICEGILSFFVVIFTIAGLLLPRGTPIIKGSLQLIGRFFKYTAMGGAALLGLLLLPGIPLLIIWIIIKRVTAEPYKTSWARRKRLAIRTTGGVFLYLLALECISLYAPLRSAPVLQRLVWQAGPLSRAGKWFGLCVYGVSTLWMCTNHTGGYFVYRGARKVGAKITPPPQTRLRRNICEFILLPAAMVYNGDAYAAAQAISMISYKAAISDVLRYMFVMANLSAPALLGWTTLVVAVFLLDLLGYWLFYVWSGWNQVRDETWRSPLDVMSIHLFAFCVRYTDGETLCDKWEKEAAAAKSVVTDGAKSESADGVKSEGAKTDLVEGSVSKDVDKGLMDPSM
ncbi:hypothetical protein B0H19DRAFT_1225740 [Mycena capillaripes]|nr:hypothetical protein B0H19DRAFT_1225740 [Mycena capillaripes]